MFSKLVCDMFEINSDTCLKLRLKLLEAGLKLCYNCVKHVWHGWGNFESCLKWFDLCLKLCLMQRWNRCLKCVSNKLRHIYNLFKTVRDFWNSVETRIVDLFESCETVWHVAATDLATSRDCLKLKLLFVTCLNKLRTDLIWF